MKSPAWVIVKEDGEEKKIIFEPEEELSIHNDLNLWDLSETQYQGGKKIK